MKQMFEDKEVNRKHQYELDFAKGIAIIFMVLVHTNEYWQGTAYEGGMYNRIVEFLGSPPVAPVFMILLGVGIIYSKNNTSKQFAKRGIKLIMAGYFLSFMTDIVPGFILYKRENDFGYMEEAICYIRGIDILHFAGLTFLFFSIVRKYKLSKKALAVIWCIFASLHMCLKGISFSSEFANAFFGLFWGTNEYSWFPFLNWITYPIVGYIFGDYLVRCTDKQLFYKKIMFYSFWVSIPLWIYSYVNDVQFGAFGELWQETYYHHDIAGNIILTAFALFWISLFYFIAPHIPEIIKKLLCRWSKNITAIYSISYVLLGFSMLILSEDGYSPPVVCCLAVVLFVLTDFCCLVREKAALKLKGIAAKKANPYSSSVITTLD